MATLGPNWHCALSADHLIRVDNQEISHPHQERYIKVCHIHERQLALEMGKQLVSGNSRRDPLTGLAPYEADMVPGSRRWYGSQGTHPSYLTGLTDLY